MTEQTITATPNHLPSKVVVERSVYEQFNEYTRVHARTEWGGVLLGYYKPEGTFHATLAILPPQSTQNQVYCEFKKEFFLAISMLGENLEEEGFEPERIPKIGCWIHTHPGITAFFSGTDVETFTQLTKLNPSLTAVVLDPTRKYKKGHSIALNSKAGKDYSFTKIPLVFQSTPLTNSDEELLRAIKREVEKDYFKRILKVNTTVKVFTHADAFESLSYVVTSRFNDLENRLAGQLEIVLHEMNYTQDLFALDAHLKRHGIAVDVSRLITSYKVTNLGLSYVTDLFEDVTARFIPWSKVKEVTLTSEPSLSLCLRFKIVKKWLRSELVEANLLTQEPNELLQTIARYCGHIRRLVPPPTTFNYENEEPTSPSVEEGNDQTQEATRASNDVTDEVSDKVKPEVTPQAAGDN